MAELHPEDDGVRRYEVRRVADEDDEPVVVERHAERPPVVRREETVTEPAPEPGGFSLAAGFYGWAVATFFTFVFVTLAALLLGGAAADATTDGQQVTMEQATTVGLVAGLVAVFLAYLLGGYAAGRIGLWNGALHGASVVGWTLLFAILGVLLGAWVGDQAGIVVNAPFAIEGGALTAAGLVAAVVLLVAMLAGATLGGVLGDRTRLAERAAERRVAYRGRPL